MCLKIVIAAIIAYTASAAPLEGARELSDDNAECLESWREWCEIQAGKNSDIDYDQCVISSRLYC